MTSIDRRRFAAATIGMAAGSFLSWAAEADPAAVARRDGPAVKRIRAGVLDVASLESGPADGGAAAFSSDPARFCRYLWQDFSPTWRFDEATFRRSAASFDNPDFIAVALHSYRYRIGAVPGDPALEGIERQLATSPKITVPTIVVKGADEGVDRPEASDAIARHFTNLRRASVLKGVGHNAPQEAPDLFAAAILALGD